MDGAASKEGVGDARRLTGYVALASLRETRVELCAEL
jgi:hypothetical protein